jgi:heme-degrading monooxygenase HmoA
MPVDVMIKRKVEQGRQAKELVPLIMHLRALATHQPGYISGTTLSNVEHPDECLVISTWKSIEDWNRWRNSKQRMAIDEKIEALTGEKTEYSIYAPMVVHTDQGRTLHKEIHWRNDVR